MTRQPAPVTIPRAWTEEWQPRVMDQIRASIETRPRRTVAPHYVHRAAVSVGLWDDASWECLGVEDYYRPGEYRCPDTPLPVILAQPPVCDFRPALPL